MQRTSLDANKPFLPQLLTMFSNPEQAAAFEEEMRRLELEAMSSYTCGCPGAKHYCGRGDDDREDDDRDESPMRSWAEYEIEEVSEGDKNFLLKHKSDQEPPIQISMREDQKGGFQWVGLPDCFQSYLGGFSAADIE